ncbi:MAG: nucleotidyltransferase domain-containing protein [Candidatus Methylomirabilales bacterium]
MTPVSLTLKYLFSSKLRVKVLAHFFLRPGEAFHVRRLAAELEESAGSVARELAHLEEAGVLSSHAVGNQKHYALRADNPILEDLRNLFLKTSGASVELKSALEGIAGVEVAFIYGSYASGEAHAASDIDLMVIGEVSDRRLAPAVARVERRLKRRINYTLYTRGEAERRLGKKGAFVHEVLAGPKIVLLGNSDDRLFRVA